MVLDYNGFESIQIRKGTEWLCGPGSSVGITTGYGVDGWRIESHTPVQTDLGAHPGSCTMGTGTFPGVESGRGVTSTPHPSSAEV
jgi:hypothetical protein